MVLWQVCIKAETTSTCCMLHPINPVYNMYWMPLPALKDSVLNCPGLTSSTKSFWINLISLTLHRLSTALTVGYELLLRSAKILYSYYRSRLHVKVSSAKLYLFYMGTKGAKHRNTSCSIYQEQVCGVSTMKSQKKFKFLTMWKCPYFKYIPSKCKE